MLRTEKNARLTVGPGLPHPPPPNLTEIPGSAHVCSFVHQSLTADDTTGDWATVPNNSSANGQTPEDRFSRDEQSDQRRCYSLFGKYHI